MNDEDYMLELLKISEKSIASGNSPFAAIIVKEGEIISKGHNQVITNSDPTMHGEISALRTACKKLKTFHLEGCIVYSTNEPCPMCYSALHWAKIKKLVWGIPRSFAVEQGFKEDEGGKRNFVDFEVKGNFLETEIRDIFKKWKAGEHTRY